MQYFILVPSTYGELGPKTKYQASTGAILSPEILLDMLPANDITSVGGGNTFLTDRLAVELSLSSLTGYELRDVKVGKADQFDIMCPEHIGPLPRLKWLKIFGLPNKDDFFIHQNYLVASERALDLLKCFSIEHCEIIRLEDFPATWPERRKLFSERARRKLKESPPSKDFPNEGHL